MLSLWLLIAYFAVQYIQPGIKVPALAPLRPALSIGAVLALVAVPQMMAAGNSFVWPRHSRLFMAMYGLMLLSMTTSLNRWNGFENLGVMATNLAIYVIMTQIIDTPRKLRLVMWVFVLIHIWVGIDGVMAFSEGKKQGAQGLKGVLANFLGDVNDYALALVIMVPFAYFFMIQTRSFILRGGLIGCITLFASAIMGSLSRGGQLGLGAVIAAIATKSKRKGPVLVVAGCMAVLALAASGQYWARMGTLGDVGGDKSAQSRFHTWGAGLKMGLTHPFGVGVGAYVTGYRVGGYYADRPAGTSGLLTAHSTYFLIIAELGVLGIIVFIKMIRACFASCRNVLTAVTEQRLTGESAEILGTAATTLQVSMIGFLVSGAFLSATYYPHFWYLMGFIVAAENIANRYSVIPAPPPAPATVVAPATTPRPVLPPRRPAPRQATA